MRQYHQLTTSYTLLTILCRAFTAITDDLKYSLHQLRLVQTSIRLTKKLCLAPETTDPLSLANFITSASQMIFGLGFGLGFGSLAGLSVGPYLFGLKKPKNYGSLDESADTNNNFLAPEDGCIVGEEMRSLLEYTERWTFWPDYQQVNMINRVLKVMWPSITAAVMAEVFKGAKQPLKEQVFSKMPFIEDIVLGTEGMNADNKFDIRPYVQGKQFTIGDIPPRLGGIKMYDTSDDEVIMEMPLIWGSTMAMDVGVFVRFGPIRLFVPLKLSHLHFKVDVRITIKPLVDTIPCVGGATVSLLGTPHVDFNLQLFKGVDLMALPILQDAIRMVLQQVLNGMVVYPNSMSFPIMPNFGIPPAPKGTLEVKLLRAEGIKGGDDTYVKLEIRKGRPQISKTVKNATAPEYNEQFHLIIDDFQVQRLNIELWNDTLGWSDACLGVGDQPFCKVVGQDEEGKDIIKNDTIIESHGQEHLIEVKLYKPEKKGALSGVLNLGSKGVSLVKGFGSSKTPSKKEMKAELVGTVYLKVMFTPFFQPKFDDEEAVKAAQEAKGVKKNKALMPAPAARTVTVHVADSLKGVLTVQLVRCKDLMDEKDLAVYVKLLVSDSDKDELQKSTTILNESSPRWGNKFDFVMISAGSMLHVEVMNKVSSFTSFLSLTSKKSDSSDVSLGKLSLPVKDVARNGRLKDTWTLQDAEKGQIELVLSWQNCYMQE